jgi:hypothetical protein
MTGRIFNRSHLSFIGVLALLSGVVFLIPGEVRAADPLELDAVAPRLLANEEMTTLTITGSGFAAETQFTLVGGGIYEMGTTGENEFIFGTGLAADGGLVYASGFGLSVVNISKPSAPELLGTEFSSCVGSLALARGHAYISGNRWQGSRLLCVVDVGDPERPVQVSQRTLPCGAQSVAASQDALYLGCQSGELLVMDLADPAQLPMWGPTPMGGSWSWT